jgi:predicted TPR repeat methyltransferase
MGAAAEGWLSSPAPDFFGRGYGPCVSDTEPVEGELIVHLPQADAAGLDQDAEWCEIETPEGRRRIRFHDYADIFGVPGLYERLFYDELECCSPSVVAELLRAVTASRGDDVSDLVVLDVGAGNGMVGEELRERGVSTVVGVDILPAAAEATERDRPGVYDDYRIVDLTDPPAADDEALRDAGFNCLTTVAALGFGDMPPEAFARAFDYVGDGGLIAFTIKERFTHVADDESGFSRLLRELEAQGRLRKLEEKRYQHRLAVSGQPLHYVAYVAEKLGDAPVA